MPTKKDTMYLSTVHSKQTTLTNPIVPVRSTNLNTKDINQKAKPRLRDTSMNLRTDDIDEIKKRPLKRHDKPIPQELRTKPNLRRQAKPKPRQRNIIHQPVPKPQGPPVYIDSLYTKDINGRKKREMNRNTNPLDPVYQFDFRSDGIVEFGKIKQSKPRQLHKQMDREEFNLMTGDINGAQASTFGNRMFKEKVI